MTSTDATQGTGGLRPARRTIVKGAAWAVPAIAVAAPAQAATASDYLVFVQTGACKSPGNSCASFNKGYKFTFNVTNEYECDITITGATPFVVTSGSTPGALTLVPFFIPDAGVVGLVITVNATNSANSVFTGYFDVSFLDCEGNPDTSRLALTVTGTPPDCDCPGAPATTVESVEEPAVEEPAVEEPAVEAPAVEEPAIEAPAVEAPAVEEPTVDTAETTASPQG